MSWQPDGQEGVIVYDEQRHRRAVFDGYRYWIYSDFGVWNPQDRTAYLDSHWRPAQGGAPS